MDSFNEVRQKLGELFENKYAHAVIAGLIIISTVSIGYEVSLNGNENTLLSAFNNFVVMLFAIEITARIIAHGKDFFKDPWHVFDFVVVFVSLLSFGGFFQIFRAFRLFWFLRTVTVFPQFEHLISALGYAIPHMLSTCFMLLFAIYIFALVGIIEFGPSHPELFGSISTAMGTIIHSILMEHTWSERLEVLRQTHNLAWLYVLPMIIILNLLLLHLILGVIINALARQHERDVSKQGHSFLERWFKGEHQNAHHDPESPLSPDTKLLIHEIRKLQNDVNELKKK